MWLRVSHFAHWWIPLSLPYFEGAKIMRRQRINAELQLVRVLRSKRLPGCNTAGVRDRRESFSSDPDLNGRGTMIPTRHSSYISRTITKSWRRFFDRQVGIGSIAALHGARGRARNSELGKTQPLVARSPPKHVRVKTLNVHARRRLLGCRFGIRWS